MRKNLLLILLMVASVGQMNADSCCTPCTTPATTDSCCKPCENPKVFTPSNCDDCNCKHSSHTFFSVHPQFQMSSPERISSFRDRMMARKDGIYGTVQLVTFGGRSTRATDLANFFTPFCSPLLTVAEQDPNVDTGVAADLDAQHFNIATVNQMFASKISFQPRQSIWGLGLEYKQCLYETEKGHHLWLGLSSSLVRVKNTMGFVEEVTNTGGGLTTVPDAVANGAVANMTAAFVQSKWCFGKIPVCPLIKWGLADIEATLGYIWTNSDEYFAESFAGILFPTGNRPQATFVFEPIVGHNKHWGVFFGSSVGIQVWVDDQSDDRKVWFHADWNTTYLFSRCETRSFDLKCKPWSRYMEVYADLAQATLAAAGGAESCDQYLSTPGINVFTQQLNVSPRFSHTFSSALTGRFGGIEAEIGWNFYNRAAECVELSCPWKEVVALKDNAGCGQTNGLRTINKRNADNEVAAGGHVQPLSGYANNIIKESDLNLESAAHPMVLSHSIFGSFAYRWDEWEFPMFLGLGASYEFGSDNAALSRWLLWAKFGISF